MGVVECVAFVSVVGVVGIVAVTAIARGQSARAAVAPGRVELVVGNGGEKPALEPPGRGNPETVKKRRPCCD